MIWNCSTAGHKNRYKNTKICKLSYGLPVAIYVHSMKNNSEHERHVRFCMNLGMRRLNGLSSQSSAMPHRNTTHRRPRVDHLCGLLVSSIPQLLLVTFVPFEDWRGNDPRQCFLHSSDRVGGLRRKKNAHTSS
jgi:hypothetical protein